MKKGQKQAVKFSYIKMTEKTSSDEGTFRFPKWPRNKQNIQNSHWPGGEGFVDSLLSDSYVDTINNNRLTSKIEFTVKSNFITLSLLVKHCNFVKRGLMECDENFCHFFEFWIFIGGWKSQKKFCSQQFAPSLLMSDGVSSGLRPKCSWFIHRSPTPFWQWLA